MKKITAIEDKVDYLLSAFNDAFPFVVTPETTVAEQQTASIKPTFANIEASHSKEIMKNVYSHRNFLRT